MSKRSELVNLGDPLPLSYMPVRRRSIHNPNPQQQQLPHQQQQQHRQQISNALPMHNTSIVTPASTAPELRLFITNNKPYMRVSLPTKERVKNKLRQLIHEVNELEQIEERQLLEIEERLNGLSMLLNQENQRQLEVLEQEINTEDELLTELENTKSSLQRLRRLNKQNYNFINNWKYWILWGLLLSVGFFLLSSLIIADFKYQYCYYFC
ncbi:hypothetical protein Cantr_04344 [Candida viswanathii]|uniref:Uncharacterized protein n=1 Tax=Candida viswanathii TaxID=5486 RepID=A0A367XMZ1_9ASCO|nr:hypothetical protein Cantr_04344 [Candida viswanathii]